MREFIVIGDANACYSMVVDGQTNARLNGREKKTAVIEAGYDKIMLKLMILSFFPLQPSLLLLLPPLFLLSLLPFFPFSFMPSYILPFLSFLLPFLIPFFLQFLICSLSFFFSVPFFFYPPLPHSHFSYCQFTTVTSRHNALFFGGGII